ncbi:hypothetical protein AB4Z48_32535 [Cupriavidus sp. 2TAF22]|uniref:hypothetical protein n=1 Tax=unclassified Cupriavidus TaxID=2640874 RepID=UPI003F928163
MELERQGAHTRIDVDDIVDAHLRAQDGDAYAQRHADRESQTLRAGQGPPQVYAAHVGNSQGHEGDLARMASLVHIGAELARIFRLAVQHSDAGWPVEIFSPSRL